MRMILLCNTDQNMRIDTFNTNTFLEGGFACLSRSMNLLFRQIYIESNTFMLWKGRFQAYSLPSSSPHLTLKEYMQFRKSK